MRHSLPLFSLLALSLPLFAQQPQVSHPHGYCSEAFMLELAPGDDAPEGAAICYTLDGSAPTSSSLRYFAPLYVNHNTLLRAAYVCGDSLVGTTATATYLFMKDVLSAPDVPTGYPSTWGPYIQTSGTAKGDYGMDPEIAGNASLRPKVIEGLEALPTLSIVTDRDHFFSHDRDSVTGGIYIYTGPPVGDKTGRDWVRPVSVELFGCGEDMTVDCGIKIHGGHSRLSEKTPKHSFRLMFKSKYGPSKLKYPVFGEDGPDKYDQLTLRCMFGNTWTHWDQSQRQRAQYTRDMWARSTQHLMGHPAARGRYVNLFINGMYWGIYVATERVNDYYCSSNFGGKKENYDVIKVDEEQGEKVVAGEGTMDSWEALFAAVNEAATSNAAFFRLIGCDEEGQRVPGAAQLLDLDNFIDYMLINQYGGNDDWDKHNWLAFADRKDSTQGFRFLCWDTEIIFTSDSYNAFDRDNSRCPSRILTKLSQNPNFAHRYMDRAYRHLVAPDGLLTPQGVVRTWDSLYAIIEQPLWAECARWGDYRRDVHHQCNTLFRPDKDFQTERNRLLNSYFPNRSATVISQLKSKGLYSSVNAPRLKYNGTLDLVPDTLRQGDVLSLQYQNTILYTLDGSYPVVWTSAGRGQRTTSAQTFTMGRNLLDDIDWTADSFTLCAISRQGTSSYSPVVQWTFVLDHSTAIRDIAQDVPLTPDCYDLQGRPVSSAGLSPGLYLSAGKKIVVR